MKTGLRPGQWFSLLRLLSRRPVLSARMNARLAGRVLSFLAENPDLLRIGRLLDPDAGGPIPGGTGEGGLIFLMTSEGEPRFSFSLSSGGRGNLSKGEMAALLEEDRDLPGQVLVFDEAALGRLKESFEKNLERDVFYTAALSLWESWREGLITLRPAPPDEELIKAITPEDALSRFGPRFGLYPRGPMPRLKFLEAPRRLAAALRRG